jgi:hypothetical protein
VCGYMVNNDLILQQNFDITISILPFFTNDTPRYHCTEVLGAETPLQFREFPPKSLRFKHVIFISKISRHKSV